MSLAFASAQLSFFIRAKLWKEVITCKNNMFSNFKALPFCQNIHI